MLPSDPWASVEAFRDMVGRYAEAGVNEFLIDQPRADQQAVLERVATDMLSANRPTPPTPSPYPRERGSPPLSEGQRGEPL
jgi:hypothetical protein